ncbi:OmpA family protein [Qipengyuania sp.]|uniref:OmpA family protein n=1 Tax=Qipengyuania sp. TaxID=2004515 RepID=UPI003BAB856A
MTQRTTFTLALAGTMLLLGACEDTSGPTPAEDAPGETRSIFRPEFQVEPIEELTELGTLETRILFPEGAELTEEALAELATVLASPQIEEAGAIILRGHTDSGGSDQGNLRASQARAEAVRDWLVENGVAENRIRVIAFGEQNPVAPNALPDGSPNEEGRAANRRVEIEVRSEARPAPPEQPTLAESLASSAEGGSKEDDEPDE